MLTSTAALWLWTEASATAVVYPAAGLVSSRRRTRAPRALATLAALLAGQVVVAVLAWRLAGGPHAGTLATRASFAALGLAGWGL
ncbi:MAG TPA: hypothetical protein VHE35_14405, partial [Kofleriaceae bacterium]|nr:hypothetical protein [Kofleriaceae bacterium]